MRTCLFSQSLFGLPLEEAAQATAAAGFSAIELACWAPHLDHEYARDHAAAVAASMRSAGLKVAALSLTNRFTETAGLDQQIREAADFISFAGVFDTSMIKLTPGPPAAVNAVDKNWQCLGEAVRQLLPVAKKAGVRLAFETHMRQLTDTLASSLRFLDMIGSERVGLTVDFCNLAFAGEDLAAAIRLLGPRTLHTHVKNGHVGPAGEWHFAALDTGSVDYGQALRLLRDAGYAGYLSVECLGPDAQTAPTDTARRDLSILNRWLAQLRPGSQHDE